MTGRKDLDSPYRIIYAKLWFIRQFVRFALPAEVIKEIDFDSFELHPTETVAPERCCR